jgi:uncharacterized protein (TIGR00255 family)
MIKSMTGFASAAHEDDRATITVTVRALNNRHLDVQLRVPQLLSAIETDVRALVAKHVTRGRVEVSVALQLRQTPSLEVEFNEAFGQALEAALERARGRGLVTGALTPGDLLRLPQALTIRERPTETDGTLLEDIVTSARAAVGAALADLDSMRSREGEHLRADLENRRTVVADIVERLVITANEGCELLEQRLTERVAQIRSELPPDEAAVAQEIVRFAARSDISEEIARFRAHLAHWTVLAEGSEPCGRKLDFLLQEMNREINTMGSKADGVRVPELVIAAKVELEKMREQVQNVE